MTESNLEKITNSGRNDVLPGYILSRPRFKEIAECDIEVLSRYKSTAYAGMSGLPDFLQEQVLKEVARDVKTASFTFGMPLWCVWMRTFAMLPFATYLCAKVKHPDIKLSTVEEIIAKMKDDAVAELHETVLSLWDVIEQKARRWKSRSGPQKAIDWDMVFQRFVALGGTAEQFALTTYPQLAAMFADPSEQNKVTEDSQMQSAFNIFDSICDANGCEPKDLATLADDVLMQHIRTHLPEEKRHYKLSIETIQKYLREYLAACA